MELHRNTNKVVEINTKLTKLEESILCDPVYLNKVVRPECSGDTVSRKQEYSQKTPRVAIMCVL